MRQISPDSHDVPAPPPVVERRRRPDRRMMWRGGRRDGDWRSRPPGALARFAATEGRSTRLGALSALLRTNL